MQPFKLSTGALITIIGWLLSAYAVGGAIAFAMVWQSVFMFGGVYPPELIYFLLWPLLVLGSFVSYLGAKMIHRPILMLFPLANAVIMSATLWSMSCFPIERCLVTL